MNVLPRRAILALVHDDRSSTAAFQSGIQRSDDLDVSDVEHGDSDGAIVRLVSLQDLNGPVDRPLAIIDRDDRAESIWPRGFASSQRLRECVLAGTLSLPPRRGRSAER